MHAYRLILRRFLPAAIDMNLFVPPGIYLSFVIRVHACPVGL